MVRHFLRTTLRTGAMPVGARIVDRIVAVAEEMDHHPDLDLRYASLHVLVTTHSRGTLTEADIVLAERITEIAEELGVPLDPRRVNDLEIGITVASPERVRAFWAAVLGYEEDDGELSDPHGRLPHVWFRRASGEAPRGELDLDVHVPHDVAESRVQAAVDAGGRLVSDAEAPTRWVLADPEGVEVRVCTWREGH
ncbi:4a-hydroxytetrahydrobiopterin dehydratase [Georgenia satyanarayanai]|uniref:Putative pterin-4-alpha-carbinolamine dehydratase n=1 Tax=Georgenia satyanarayanai TaxID=860221 RepID=A0A2Y8ZWA9_9MICO|nr:4a-hydroxytetrahydrobiopterin dehydratase [Georgenia satyanarayanai]SSA36364.1 4a-hydroxytetrahydrobiopterin dehydratase [Georgenia satyanarayanai]